MEIIIDVFVSDLIPKTKTNIDRYIIDSFSKGHLNMFQRHGYQNVLPVLKKGGVTGMELTASYAMPESHIREIQGIVNHYTLPVVTIHHPLTSILSVSEENIIALCTLAKRFESRFVVLHADILGKKLFNETFTRWLTQIEKTYHIKFCIENMPKSPFSLLKPYAWQEKKFGNMIRSRNLRAVLDTTHMAQAGGSIERFFQDNKEHVINIHLSNFKKHFVNSKLLLTEYTHLPLSDGDLKIEEFLKMLKRARYNSIITLEVNGTLQQERKSVELIQAVMG